MRLVTYATAQGRSFGILTPSGVIDLAGRLGVASIEEMLEGDLLPVAAGYARAAADVPAPTLLKPLHRPGKCFCVGVNYPDRDAEYKDGRPPSMFMSLFQRVPESLVGPDEPVLRPPESVQLDYEGEIALVIGKAGRRIARENAMAHVAGYTLANEGSVRDWMRHGKFNVTQGKNFYRSGSLGPWIVTPDEAGPGPFTLTTRVNGEVRQQDSTARMIFPMDEIIAYISTFTPLAPGDLILTGTPTGAGARFDPPRWLVPGDVVEVEVPGIGVLRNEVKEESSFF
jgi:5-carboxymethyl-2-hydroxymuconate isomerase